MADDIGWFNISCNDNGIMGYRNPKAIDPTPEEVGAERAQLTLRKWKEQGYEEDL